MRKNTFGKDVRALESIRARFGAGDEARKKEMLEALSASRIPRGGNARVNAKLLLRFHESLLFLRAYPDNEEIFALAENLLDRFSKLLSPSLCRRLAGEGIVGTTIEHSFDYVVARELAKRYPRDIRIDWKEIEDEAALQLLLPALAGQADDLAIDDEDVATKDWIEAAAGDAGDLAWLTRRLDSLKVPPRVRDHLYDALKLPVRWAINAPTASRTGARYRCDDIFYHREPLMRRPKDVASFITKPLSPRTCGGPDARRLIALAGDSLACRSREIFPISHANPEDVLVWPAGRGLEIVTIGTLPNRRLLLESLWGFLLLKNGVPAGYGCYSALFDSAEVAFNIFESFRQGESAFCYVSLLRVVHAHTRATTFAALKYQIGDANEEAIRSGAFWFYEKLGFLPHDPETLAIVRAEQKRIAENRGYRTPAATLRRIAESNIFLHLGGEDRAVLGELKMGRVGLAITRHAATAGANRSVALANAVKRFEKISGAKLPREGISAEYALFLSSLTKLDSWPRTAKQKLAKLATSKGASSEREFARLQAEHRQLRAAIIAEAK